MHEPSAPWVATGVTQHAGEGVEATVGGRRVRLGRREFAWPAAAIAGTESDGAVVLAEDDGPIAAFHLGERLRTAGREAIAALTALGLEVEIASGDAPSRVAAVAGALGIGRWQGGQRPADKLRHLQTLRAVGARVIVVGDGINDAPALAGADVGIAVSSASDLARASSDVVLAGGDLRAIADAITLARACGSIVRQNQRWARGYNLLAIPAAALGCVAPWLAALGMSFSSLLVVLNALRIGRGQTVRSGAQATR